MSEGPKNWVVKIGPEAEKPASSEDPPPVEKVSKLFLHIIAFVFLLLSLKTLVTAFHGTLDGIHIGLLEVWAHLYEYYRYQDQNRFLCVSGLLVPVSAGFVVLLSDAIKDKKVMCCSVVLVILLGGLYFAGIPYQLAPNPIDEFLHRLDDVRATQLAIAWRYLVYCGLCLGVSLRIWLT